MRIDWIGGNCPVQAEGTMSNGRVFYFRARYSSWSVTIARNMSVIFSEGEWEYEEPWGVTYEAGWMPEDVAIKMILKAEYLYKMERKKG